MVSGKAAHSQVGLRPGWWAPGLTLAERCAGQRRPADLSGPDGEGLATPARADQLARQLARWRDIHDQHADGRLDRRLAALGLDEAGLVALLAEDSAALVERTVRPRWATVAEDVLRWASDRAAEQVGQCRPDDAHDDGFRGFAAILAPFADFAGDRLASVFESNHQLDARCIDRMFAQELTRTLVGLAARTLVLELNVLRVTGRLTGPTPRGRFASFVRHFACRDGLAALLHEYPVLARLLAQATTNAVDAHRELLQRFATDRAAIVRVLLGGGDPGRLVSVRGHAGDGHRRGRTVAMLGFADGSTVVYKPRPLAAHRHFNETISWLNTAVDDLGLRTVSLIDRGCYGWLEFVQHRPCESEQQLHHYYRRQGALLALLYALDACDVHCENLIAHADQPMLIDVEALFHPPLDVVDDRADDLADPLADDPVRSVLNASVQRVGLLPELLWSGDRAVDCSGLGGDAGQQSPLASAMWADAGTDEMRLVRRYGVSTSYDNQPALDGATADPAAYLPMLVAGFRAGYAAIVDHRADWLQPGGLLDRFAGDEIRVILRPTQAYATLLSESTHPDAMRSALDRDRVLGHLWSDTGRSRVRELLAHDEIGELWAGDVPLITGQAGLPDVSCAGLRVAAAWAEVPLHRAARKIQAMGDRDWQTQKWVVLASLASRTAARPAAADRRRARTGPCLQRLLGPMDPAGPDPTWVLAAVRRIADEVVASAVVDGDRMSWLGMHCTPDADGRPRWSVAPAGFDLYGGASGIALFLASAAALTGDSQYADAAGRAMWMIPRLLDGQVRNRSIGCGAFDGLAGLAYAASHLAIQLDDRTVMGWIEPLAEAAGARVAQDSPLDVVSGTAGCLAAMTAIHQTTGSAAAWRTATRCADHLVANLEAGARRTEPGFAHGDVGTGWALLRFVIAGAGPTYAEAALGALTDERAGRLSRRGGWCRGLTGAALAYADCAAHTDNRLVADQRDRAIDGVLSVGPATNHSLCHGELGNLEVFNVGLSLGRHDLAGPRHARIRALIAELDGTGLRCGTPGSVRTAGLMTGIAGIGHGLARLCFAERTPSVLLLEPPEFHIHPPTERESS